MVFSNALLSRRIFQNFQKILQVCSMSKITIEKSKYKHTVDTIDNSIPIDEIRIDILFKYLASKWFNIPVRVPLLWSILYKKQDV